jgi:predicted metalloprotease with PDZ domain
MNATERRLFRRIAALCLFLVTVGCATAQDYQYRLAWTNPQSHTYEVSLTTSPEPGEYTDFQVPAWRPGRYYIQDYAAAISGFTAQNEDGVGLKWRKIDNNTWRVSNPEAGPIIVAYNAYANTMDAGSSVLNHEEAYFNPVNFFMHVRDRYDVACKLTVPSMPSSWRSATALKKGGAHNVFTADSYHEFVDSPTILSPTLKTLHSRIGETDFYFHFQGRFPDNKEVEDAYQMNMGKIIREQAAIFGGLPMKEYHFIYHLLPFNIGHAVEHKFSSSFALPDRVADSPQAIARLNSISSHEFFHLWNVKRIRPAVMWPYNYQDEAHTTLHWFTEGVTDYYTSLAIARCGLYSRKVYLSILARTIASLENNYASKVVSPSQASFDSWLDRSDYAIPYHRISYYTLGSRVGMLLDLEIRRRTEGKKSLDDVMVHLWNERYKKNVGVEEDGVQAAVEAVTGDDWKEFFDRYVHGTESMDYAALLEPFGLRWIEQNQEDLGLQSLGILRTQETEYGLLLQTVLPGTDADRAGLGSGDVITEIAGVSSLAFDAASYFEEFKGKQKVEMKVFRSEQDESITVTWTNDYQPKSYGIKPMEKINKAREAMLESWLGSRQ